MKRDKVIRLPRKLKKTFIKATARSEYHEWREKIDLGFLKSFSWNIRRWR